jgi:hypothetical protein
MSRQLALQFRRASLWAKVAILGAVGALPALMPVVVSAAPSITNRALVSTSAQPSTTTNLTWTFNTTAATANVKQIEIEFCDQPLTGCGLNTENGTDNITVPGDAIPILPASPSVTITGTNAFNSPAISGTPPTRGNGRAGATGNQITVVLDTAAAGASSAATIAVPAFTNDETANKTYYTRMRLYSDTGTTLVWEGVFAQSTSQTLTVNARVQERLDFCVGSTSVDDATTSPGADCSTGITGSSVDIGNIDSSGVNVSPVTTTNGGSNQNGIAMVRTNAVNGATVAYHALADTSSGTLKVPGATCNAVPSTIGTDQCFNSSASKGAFSAGVEKFGMTIAAVNCVSTTAYTCSFTAGTYNLKRESTSTGYDGNGGDTYSTGDKDIVSGTTANSYAWDANPANTTTIASSTGSTVKVIDDEALILKFAATSGITTPTGSYTVQADFIATATF